MDVVAAAVALRPGDDDNTGARCIRYCCRRFCSPVVTPKKRAVCVGRTWFFRAEGICGNARKRSRHVHRRRWLGGQQHDGDNGREEKLCRKTRDVRSPKYHVFNDARPPLPIATFRAPRAHDPNLCSENNRRQRLRTTERNGPRTTHKWPVVDPVKSYRLDGRFYFLERLVSTIRVCMVDNVVDDE